MNIEIGAFDPATRQVRVKYTYGGVEHDRHVNACLDDDGHYDAPATEVRVGEVAAGVAHKIDLGLLQNVPAELPVEKFEAPATE